ncbi:MAG: GTPase Era [Clostridia bacterium]|nr:GTPase Era [Clostridia bacterium]MBQ6937439.1 GTPase Era [Clostridia bacterium]
MSNFKSGFAAIVGRPNVGKSTLTNAFIGEKAAIVSNKPQTTRSNLAAIDNGENYQIVFVDTPGMHNPRTKLGEYMNSVAGATLSDVDVAILVVEAGREVYDLEKNIIKNAAAKDIPLILAINKADTVDKETILPQISAFCEEGEFSAIVPISALKKDGVDALRDEILKHFDEGEPFYPTDIYADSTLRDMCGEIIREKILRLLDREVPHGTAVEIEKMDEGDDLTKITAVIYCEKSSHKPIIIGKKGEAIKRIGSYARKDIEKLLDTQVFLELWVKVREDWRNKGTALKELGFIKE